MKSAVSGQTDTLLCCALSSVQLDSFVVRGQPKAVKPKMRGRTLKSAVKWQGALKQQGVKLGIK
jgi:hypothetical protein